MDPVRVRILPYAWLVDAGGGAAGSIYQTAGEAENGDDMVQERGALFGAAKARGRRKLVLRGRGSGGVTSCLPVDAVQDQTHAVVRAGNEPRRACPDRTVR